MWKTVSSQSVTFKREVVLATAGKATSQANISTKKLLSDFPSHATTPINVDLLEYELCNHPDKNFVSYLCAGLRHGFDTCSIGKTTN